MPSNQVERTEVLEEAVNWRKLDDLLRDPECEGKRFIEAAEAVAIRNQEHQRVREALEMLATIRSWCDDTPGGDDMGGWLSCRHVADAIDSLEDSDALTTSPDREEKMR